MKTINIYGVILDEKGIILGKDGILHSEMSSLDESLEDALIKKANTLLNVNISILGYLGKTEDENNHNHFYSCKIINKESSTYQLIEYEKLFDSNIKYKEYIFQAIKGKYI